MIFLKFLARCRVSNVSIVQSSRNGHKVIHERDDVMAVIEPGAATGQGRLF